MHCPLCGKPLRVDQQADYRVSMNGDVFINILTCPRDECAAPYWTASEESVRSGNLGERYHKPYCFDLDTGKALVSQVSSK